MFFKKKNIYNALKDEADPIRKKLLEKYNSKLIFLGEFLVITGMVPDMAEKNEYLNRIKSLSIDFHNINKNNPEEFIKSISIIYNDWENYIINLETPEYLKKLKLLVLKHLELEKEYIIKDFMKADSNELNLLDKKDDSVLAAANNELRKAIISINKEASKIGVEPHFKVY